MILKCSVFARVEGATKMAWPGCSRSPSSSRCIMSVAGIQGKPKEAQDVIYLEFVGGIPTSESASV